MEIFDRLVLTAYGLGYDALILGLLAWIISEPFQRSTVF